MKNFIQILLFVILFAIAADFLLSYSMFSFYLYSSKVLYNNSEVIK